MDNQNNIKLLDKLSNFYLDIKFITFAFSLISSILGFFTVYMFLYGFYFGGDSEFKISNFYIISNFIPFDFRTLSMLSIYFICIFNIILGALSLFKKRPDNKAGIFAVISFAIVLTLMLTVFFANDLKIKNVLSVSLLWLFIGIIVWFIYILIKVILKPNLLFTFLYGIILFICIFSISSMFLTELIHNDVLYRQVSFLIYILLWLIVLTLLIHFNDKKWMLYLKYLPVSLILYLGIKNFFIDINLSNLLNVICILTINILVYFVGLYLKSKEYFKKIKLKEKWNNQKSKILEPRKDVKTEDIKIDKEKGILYNILFGIYQVMISKKDLKVVFVVVLLIAFIFIPQFSMSFGQIIRELAILESPALEIVYTNSNSEEKSVLANYYIEGDSTLYISNEEWKLEVIRPVNYHIKPNE